MAEIWHASVRIIDARISDLVSYSLGRPFLGDPREINLPFADASEGMAPGAALLDEQGLAVRKEDSVACRYGDEHQKGG